MSYFTSYHHITMKIMLLVTLLSLSLFLPNSTALRPLSLEQVRHADRVWKLPGQPPVKFKQYAGYVTVDEKEGRELFYFFAESSDKSGLKPLVLWLNGGPGCSSLALGFGEETGPYRIHPNGTGLYLNPHAWNKEVNIIWLESPIGVGFSYARHNKKANNVGSDKQTAQDAYKFLLGWLERFPKYENCDFYLTGESYAGHYVPQLAKVIVDRNKEATLKINLKGFMVGNPAFDNYWDLVGHLDYQYYHDILSKETYNSLKENCNFHDRNCCSALCNEILINSSVIEVGQIDEYSIYTSLCVQDILVVGQRSRRQALRSIQNPFLRKRLAGYDTCSQHYAPLYFNRKDVQKALHANLSGDIPYPWSICNEALLVNWDWKESEWSMIPTYRYLIGKGLKIWVYSGDADSVVPTTGTRYSIAAMDLPINIRWRGWYHGLQLGGRLVEYKGLTYLTVRGAGHEVPLLEPARLFHVLQAFIRNETLPYNPYQ